MLSISEAVRSAKRAYVELNRFSKGATLVEEGRSFFVRYRPPVTSGDYEIGEAFPLTEGLDDETAAWIARHSQPNGHVLNVFTSDADEAIASGQARGYVPFGVERFMARELDEPPPPPRHAVVRALPSDDLDAVNACGGPAIHREQLERPSIRHYLVRDGDRVASRGTMVAQASSAFVTGMYTAPPFRRRGMGAAIVLRMLEDARTEGLRSVSLLAVPEGAPLYERLGFRTLCDVVTLARPPAEAQAVATVELAPGDELFIPGSKRLIHEERALPGGGTELLIYYLNKEICFDDAETLPFGRGLLSHAAFTAESTRRWADGEPYPWSTVKDLLESLIAEGVVRRLDDEAPDAGAPATERTSTGPPGMDPVARPDPSACWSRAEDRCAELAQRVFGLAFGLERLEAFVPVFRVAHPAFDAEGRQVGEAHVRPELLQPVATEWRVSRYPGSRFESGLINVTALRSMQRHWNGVVAWLAVARADLVPRLRSDGSHLTLGELYLLSCSLLTLPAYALMRAEDPVRSGALDPILAALFRVADGVRFSTESMMLGSSQWDAERAAGERISTDAFLHYVEKTDLFHSKGGACAGPPALVRDFLDLMLTGRTGAPRSDAHGARREQLLAAVGDLERAFDYGREGMLLHLHQRWFDVHARQRVRTLERSLRPATCPPPLRARVESWLEHAGRSMGPSSGAAARDTLMALVDALRTLAPDAPDLTDFHEAPRSEERAHLARRIRESVACDASSAGALAEAILASAAMERAHLRVVERLQSRVNRTLGRPATGAPTFDVRDLEVATGRPPASAWLAEICGLRASPSEAPTPATGRSAGVDPA